MTINAQPQPAASTSTGERIVVDEVVVTTDTNPGFFGKIARALERRPIATSVGASLGVTAAAAGAYNYRRYGNIVPPLVSSSDIVEVSRAVMSAFGR